VNAADFTDLAANFNQGISLPAAAVATAPAVAAPVVAPITSTVTAFTTATAPPTSNSKPVSVAKAVISDKKSRKTKASTVTTYAASVATIPTAGSMATPRNTDKDAKFLADR
jgi:hypothetical protein